MTLSVLFLAPCAVRADEAAPPKGTPKEMVLNGTLSWEDHHWYNSKKGILLTTTDGETVHLGAVAKPIVPDNYIGKRVAVTVLGSKTFRQSFAERMRHQEGHWVTRIDKVISVTNASGR